MSSEVEQLKAELSQLKAANQNLVNYIDKSEKEKSQKRNFDFLQLYRSEVEQLIALGMKNSNALHILLFFAKKMDKQNAIMISQKALMGITQLSRTSVHNAIKVLKDDKFVDVVKIGTANAYVINSNVFWQTDAKLKDKISIFDAKIVAIASEQDKEYFDQYKKAKLKKVPMIQEEELPVINNDTNKNQEEDGSLLDQFNELTKGLGIH